MSQTQITQITQINCKAAERKKDKKKQDGSTRSIGPGFSQASSVFLG